MSDFIDYERCDCNSGSEYINSEDIFGWRIKVNYKCFKCGKEYYSIRKLSDWEIKERILISTDEEKKDKYLKDISDTRGT